MKIKLHIVLLCCNGVKRPRFQKTIDYEVTQENLADFISRRISVLVGNNPVVIEFNERDWDKREMTLRSHAQMRDAECKAYLRSLEHDGWDEIQH